MPVGFSGSAMLPPACSVAGLIAVRVRLPKLPTRTSPGVGGDGLRSGADRDGRAGLQRGDVNGCHRVAAVVGDEGGGRARGRHRDGDRHRFRPHRNGLARPPGAEVDRGHAVRVEVRHQRNALASGAAGCDRHRVGLHPGPRRVQHLVRRRVDLVQGVGPLGHHQQSLAPGRVGQRRGQAADRHLGPDTPAGQVDRGHVRAGQGDRGTRGDPGHAAHGRAADGCGARRQGGDQRHEREKQEPTPAHGCPQPRAQAAPAGRSVALQPAASPSGQKSPVTSSCT